MLLIPYPISSDMDRKQRTQMHGCKGQRACLTQLLQVQEEVGVDAAHPVPHQQGHEEKAEDPPAAEDDANPFQHPHGTVGVPMVPLHVPTGGMAGISAS